MLAALGGGQSLAASDRWPPQQGRTRRRCQAPAVQHAQLPCTPGHAPMRPALAPPAAAPPWAADAHPAAAAGGILLHPTDQLLLVPPQQQALVELKPKPPRRDSPAPPPQRQQSPQELGAIAGESAATRREPRQQEPASASSRRAPSPSGPSAPRDRTSSSGGSSSSSGNRSVRVAAVMRRIQQLAARGDSAQVNAVCAEALAPAQQLDLNCLTDALGGLPLGAHAVALAQCARSGARPHAGAMQSWGRALLPLLLPLTGGNSRAARGGEAPPALAPAPSADLASDGSRPEATAQQQQQQALPHGVLSAREARHAGCLLSILESLGALRAHLGPAPMEALCAALRRGMRALSPGQLVGAAQALADMQFVPHGGPALARGAGELDWAEGGGDSVWASQAPHPSGPLEEVEEARPLHHDVMAAALHQLDSFTGPQACALLRSVARLHMHRRAPRPAHTRGGALLEARLAAAVAARADWEVEVMELLPAAGQRRAAPQPPSGQLPPGPAAAAGAPQQSEGEGGACGEAEGGGVRRALTLDEVHVALWVLVRLSLPVSRGWLAALVAGAARHHARLSRQAVEACFRVMAEYRWRPLDSNEPDSPPAEEGDGAGDGQAAAAAAVALGEVPHDHPVLQRLWTAVCRLWRDLSPAGVAALLWHARHARVAVPPALVRAAVRQCAARAAEQQRHRHSHHSGSTTSEDPHTSLSPCSAAGVGGGASCFSSPAALAQQQQHHHHQLGVPSHRDSSFVRETVKSWHVARLLVLSQRAQRGGAPLPPAEALPLALVMARGLRQLPPSLLASGLAALAARCPRGLLAVLPPAASGGGNDGLQRGDGDTLSEEEEEEEQRERLRRWRAEARAALQQGLAACAGALRERGATARQCAAAAWAARRLLGDAARGVAALPAPLALHLAAVACDAWMEERRRPPPQSTPPISHELAAGGGGNGEHGPLVHLEGEGEGEEDVQAAVAAAQLLCCIAELPSPPRLTAGAAAPPPPPAAPQAPSALCSTLGAAPHAPQRQAVAAEEEEEEEGRVVCSGARPEQLHVLSVASALPSLLRHVALHLRPDSLPDGDAAAMLPQLMHAASRLRAVGLLQRPGRSRTTRLASPAGDAVAGGDAVADGSSWWDEACGAVHARAAGGLSGARRQLPASCLAALLSVAAHHSHQHGSAAAAEDLEPPPQQQQQQQQQVRAAAGLDVPLLFRALAAALPRCVVGADLPAGGGSAAAAAACWEALPVGSLVDVVAACGSAGVPLGAAELRRLTQAVDAATLHLTASHASKVLLALARIGRTARPDGDVVIAARPLLLAALLAVPAAALADVAPAAPTRRRRLPRVAAAQRRRPGAGANLGRGGAGGGGVAGAVEAAHVEHVGGLVRGMTADQLAAVLLALAEWRGVRSGSNLQEEREVEVEAGWLEALVRLLQARAEGHALSVVGARRCRRALLALRVWPGDALMASLASSSQGRQAALHAGATQEQLHVAERELQQVRRLRPASAAAAAQPRAAPRQQASSASPLPLAMLVPAERQRRLLLPAAPPELLALLRAALAARGGGAARAALLLGSGSDGWQAPALSRLALPPGPPAADGGDDLRAQRQLPAADAGLLLAARLLRGAYVSRLQGSLAALARAAAAPGGAAPLRAPGRRLLAAAGPAAGSLRGAEAAVVEGSGRELEGAGAVGEEESSAERRRRQLAAVLREEFARTLAVLASSAGHGG